MTEQHWRAPITAPKDGTAIIVLSGNWTHLINWLPADDKWSAGWYFVLDGGEVLDDEDIQGWIPAPAADYIALAKEYQKNQRAELTKADAA